jgi:RNA polymerase sigma-70 factor, ECF subfamily
MWSAVDRPQLAGDCAARDEPGGATAAFARELGMVQASGTTPETMSSSRGYGSADDVELLSWSADGDRRAFDEIVARHGPFALRVAMRIVRDRALAEDLVQEAMVRAWSQARHFNPRRARFTTWLYRIVMNLCIDQGRRLQPVPLPADFNPADPAASADEMIEASQRDALLAGAVSELPVNQRAALTLVYDEGMSGAEAARVLGLSAKAVERLLARARVHLRQRLERGHSKESRRC